MPLSRRRWLQSVAGVATASLLPHSLHAAGAKPKHILLRSSWQTINIGDIGHTPGALRLFERYLPDAQITLWPSKVDNGVDKMLLAAFPKLKIVEGKLDADGKPTSKDLQSAFDSANLLVHGSGPSVVAQADVAGWSKATGKPYGIFGVTIGPVDDSLRKLLSDAQFVYCRDTISLASIKDQQVTAPTMEFGPDATFAFHLRDDQRADGFLKNHDLEDRKFICVLPRLRWTPYHKIHKRPETETTRQRDAYNEVHRETDHAKLREVIIAWVRKTGQKVLACAEMTYQVPLAKELLVDPLPDDVRKNVVWRDSYWLPDEAASVYARARAIVSCEMHSPIIAAAVGTPAFYVRQPTDTSKGQMWRDIGLKEWIFEIDATQPSQISEQLLAVHKDFPASQQKLADAMAAVNKLQKQMVASVERV